MIGQLRVSAVARMKFATVETSGNTTLLRKSGPKEASKPRALPTVMPGKPVIWKASGGQFSLIRRKVSSKCRFLRAFHGYVLGEIRHTSSFQAEDEADATYVRLCCPSMVSG